MKSGGLQRSARRSVALGLAAATSFALAHVPASELPLPWLAAFVLPGALLGAANGLVRKPWHRILTALVLQVLACYLALLLAGPMSRPAALACTILPPLAFATARHDDADAPLALFLGFCVLLVGVILGGANALLLCGYGAAACLSLRASARLQALRSARLPMHPLPVAPRHGTLLAGCSLLLSCLVAALLVDRALGWLPSPSARSPGPAAGGTGALLQRQVGLDDSFVLDGKTGVLSALGGARLVRARHPQGEPMPVDLYLRCGFFSEPELDRWHTGVLDLGPPSRPDGHTLRRPLPSLPLLELEIERFAGATRFVFLPPGSCDVDGLFDLSVDGAREWLRQSTPREGIYRVTWQDQPAPPADLPLDPRARRLGLLTLPRDLDRERFELLLDRWRVGDQPMAALARIGAGLARHCRYDRVDPTGPYQHALDNFLFADGDRRGYCMHFASAAALLLRLSGVACRIGVGLHGGEPDPAVKGARLFGAQHAHAWVEVPFAGRGYVVFDPTPPAMRGRMPGRDQDQLAVTAADTGGGGAASGMLDGAAAIAREPWTWMLALAALLLGSAWPRRAAAAHSDRSAPPVPRRLRQELELLLRALARAGHPRPPGTTLEQFAAALARAGRLPAAVAAAFDAYQQVRFGALPYDDSRAAALVQGLAAARSLPSSAQPEPAAAG